MDIRPFLSDAAVTPYMNQRIAENVDLIKTIPKRAHEGLSRRMQEEFAAAPFDEQRMRAMVQQEFGSQGYNLRRITRDQTQKLTSQLTEMRHRQVGIETYTWITSQDERVRTTHRENNNKIFAYANPPPATGNPGNDIQCRCTARPVITPRTRNRLKGVG